MTEGTNQFLSTRSNYLLVVLSFWVMSCVGCYYIGLNHRLDNKQLRSELAADIEAAWGDDEERALVVSTAVVDGKNLKTIYTRIEAGEESKALKRLEFLISMHCDTFQMFWKPGYLKGDEVRDAVSLVGFAYDRGFFNDRGNPGYLRREEIRDWLDNARRSTAETEKE